MNTPMTLLMKLASIAIHAEEFFSPDGHDFDRIALKIILNDKEVREFLDDPAHAALFPVKRNKGKE